MQPRAYRSVGRPAGPPMACSGATYSRRPSARSGVVAIAVSSHSAAAAPKSPIRTCPAPDTRRFSGFRSPWTTPACAAAPRPASTSSITVSV